MPLIATTTDYSGIDSRTGKVCHKGGHTREAKGYIRAARRADALGLAIAAGHVSSRTGMGVCALCGGDGTLAMVPNKTNGAPIAAANTLVLCHDVPQASGGAVCWCSMVLGHQSCNLAQGDTHLTDYVLHADAREYARAGGLWAPWEGTRASFGYDTTRAAKARLRADAWQAATPAGATVVASLRLNVWR